MEDVCSPDDNYVSVRVDFHTIDKLQLELTIDDILNALVKAKLKITKPDIRVVGNRIRIYVREMSEKDRKKTTAETDVFLRVQHLKRVLPNVIVKGFPLASRAVVKKNEKNGENELLVEGYGLKYVMHTEGVIATQTTSNSIMEMRDVLGIEAARFVPPPPSKSRRLIYLPDRASIINEISNTMSAHGMDIDPRHMQLLGDVMTYKGEVLGITRFGLAKMRDSVLQLASFEKTTDHLFDAAFHMKTDEVEGVSECIILGQSMTIGTGAFKVVRRLMVPESQLKPKKAMFEGAYGRIYKKEKLPTGKRVQKKGR